MTREEAIRQIENRWSIMDYGESVALGEALDMAIEALSAEAEDTQTKDRARYVAKETELAHIEARIECAKQRLQELKKHIDKAEWIPVSERLPEDDEIVLTTDNKDIVCPMLHTSIGYNRMYWLTAEEGITYNEDEITAWMPLPEPYKGGEGE